MQVEISPAAHERLERLVRKGIYASIDAALEAAVWELPLEDSEIDWAAVRAADAEADGDIAAGRFREVTPEFIAELKAIVRRRPA